MQYLALLAPAYVILIIVGTFLVSRSRRKVKGWDQEWHKAWESLADLEEKQINKEFEKLRKRLKKEYDARNRRQT